jgi:hypothetical protein
VYIQYAQGTDQWSGEIHIPTALLDSSNIDTLEKVGYLFTFCFANIINVISFRIQLGYGEHRKA